MRLFHHGRVLSGVLMAGLMFAMPVGHTAGAQVETCQTVTTLAANLGLMRGHLLVAAELFESGHYELAQRHSKHPAEEVYQELRPALARLELPGFASELSAFAEVLAEGEEGRAQFRERYGLLMHTMNALEAQLRPHNLAAWPLKRRPYVPLQHSDGNPAHQVGFHFAQGVPKSALDMDVAKTKCALPAENCAHLERLQACLRHQMVGSFSN